MAKIRSGINGIPYVPAPQADDPRKIVAKNGDVVSIPSEDGIVQAIPSITTNDFIDLSDVLHTGATNLHVPGTIDGTGITPARHAINLVSVAGKPKLAKPLFSRKGTLSIAPFGLVFLNNIAAAYADNQFTQAMSDVSPTLVGDPVKISSFVEFESRLNRLVENKLNRKLDYSDGNAQSVRIAMLFSYERELLFIQEFLNSFARKLGYINFAQTMQNINMTYPTSGVLTNPELYTRLTLLYNKVKDFKVVDPDTHTTLQFLNDYHIVEKKYIRVPTVHKKSVFIHNPFFTGTLEGINMAPYCTRLGAGDAKWVVAASGNSNHDYDLPTADYVDSLLEFSSAAEVLATINDYIALFGAFVENYATVLKFINVTESNGFVTFKSLSEFLYFTNGNIDAVQPYYSYEERALTDGLPVIENYSTIVPKIYAKCLLEYTTGDMFSTNASIQGAVARNVVRAGVDSSEKVDNSQEYFWQVWVPYSFLVEGRGNVSEGYRFVNPFNGLIYMPECSLVQITNATSAQKSAYDLNVNGSLVLYQIGLVTAASVFDVCFGTHSVLGLAAGYIPYDILGAIFGTPQDDDLYEAHEVMIAQVNATASLLQTQYGMVGAVDSIDQIGFCSVKPFNVAKDNWLLPIDNTYVTRWCDDYYVGSYPALDIQKSTKGGSQK